MLKKVAKGSCFLSSLLLAGCLTPPATPPNTVQTHQFIYQPSDDAKGCDALHAEMNEIHENIQKTKITPSFTEKLLFGEKKETQTIDVSAFEKRYERLKNLYTQKGCGKMKH